MYEQLVFFDLEGTGTDPEMDRIVEIAMVDHRGRTLFHSLVRPAVPIPADAQGIHGISDEDVEAAPLFADVAPQVEEIIDGAILVGYSSRTYDVPLLDAELRRAGRPGLPRNDDGMIDVPEIDLFGVWQEAEPRSLVSAARRFAGTELVGRAHRADVDAAVLPEVLAGMVERLDGISGDEDTASLDRLQALSRPAWMVDRGGRFRWEEEEPVFNFGRHRGKIVYSEPGVLEWMIGVDFPKETKAWCRRFLEECRPPSEDDELKGDGWYGECGDDWWWDEEEDEYDYD